MRSRGGGGGGQHGCGDMYVFGHVERRNCGERMLRLELLEKRKNKEEAGGGGGEGGGPEGCRGEQRCVVAPPKGIL